MNSFLVFMILCPLKCPALTGAPESFSQGSLTLPPSMPDVVRSLPNVLKFSKKSFGVLFHHVGAEFVRVLGCLGACLGKRSLPARTRSHERATPAQQEDLRG